MKKDLPHPKQIPTTLSAIKNEVFEKGYHAIFMLLDCFPLEIDSAEYKNRIVAAAILFERISCLVYKNRKGCYKKPGSSYYRKMIFDGWVGSNKELELRMSSHRTFDITEETERNAKVLRLIADIVCPMMACLEEQGFVSEYAYAIDYVMRRRGDIEEPVMNKLFPVNYEDYRFAEGIAKEIDRYDID